MSDLRVALVTGGTRGIGSAITTRLAGDGIHVAAGYNSGRRGDWGEIVIRVSHPPGTGLTIAVSDPPTGPMKPIDAYSQKVLQARRRGAVYLYELIPLLLRSRVEPAHGDRLGEFVEYDVDGEGRLQPVDRPFGCNTSAIVVGTVTTPTTRYPEGMTRVALFGDPTKALGSLSEPECHRIFLALDLAKSLGAPVEWFAISAGAKIAMDSGTENMDWVSRVLRRIVEFTQAGGEINVVVTGINVGAQPYWNAEATMLMHTKGILIMTPDSAMVLTGKQALEYSGGVAADDNFGIGGYDTVMGPNGQAQYWTPDLVGAIDTLLTHYKYNYVAAGDRFPRPAVTGDPVDRDVRTYPHRSEGSDFTTVGDIFSLETNPDRKKPFDIRTVIRASIDQEHEPLERWAEMGAAGTAVVFDACLGGYPVTILGTESKYGAEIGRAVVNFDGPIVFCVVSRYHGGAFVVFSATLNDNMEVAAIESSYASVIGGPLAAAVVFAGEVNTRTDNDPRVRALQDRIAEAGPPDAARLRTELESLRRAVHTEKLGDVGDEFERIHSIERAKHVGSIHTIIPASRLRPYLVEALERGMRRVENGEEAN